MYLVKGFGVNPATAINTPGIINFFGELSTQSLTYTKEKGIYKNAAISSAGFITFLCEDDGVAKELPENLSNQVILVCSYVFNKIINTRNTGYLMGQLLQELSSEFITQSKNFTGGLIESEDGYYSPDWIEWRDKDYNHLFKIWFTDRSFRNQYDEYELNFTPPLTNLDSFFAGGVAVENLLKDVTPFNIVNNMQVAKGDNPETFIKLETYEYHDPFDQDRVIPTHWGILGYGIAANNIDVIREELIKYILANSNKTREDWALILPDLFKRTEFILLPLWNKYAIEPRTTTPGIYSPIADIKESTTLLKTILPEYSTYQIDQYASLIGFPYKSVAIISVGNEDNRSNKFRLTDYFPDYIAVPSTSLDFNRMSEKTKNWALMIHELIMYADEISPTSSIPLTISKIERDGVVYLSRMVDNIQYLVVVRYSLESLL